MKTPKKPNKKQKKKPVPKQLVSKKRRRQPRGAARTVAATQPSKPGTFVPGQYFLRPEPIEANVGRPTVAITVANSGDRPIQVGSHFHFFEVNRALDFNR